MIINHVGQVIVITVVLAGTCMKLAVNPIEMTGQLPLFIVSLMKPFKDNF